MLSVKYRSMETTLNRSNWYSDCQPWLHTGTIGKYFKILVTDMAEAYLTVITWALRFYSCVQPELRNTDTEQAFGEENFFRRKEGVQCAMASSLNLAPGSIHRSLCVTYLFSQYSLIQEEVKVTMLGKCFSCWTIITLLFSFLLLELFMYIELRV